MASKVKLGYVNAWNELERYIRDHGPKKPKERRILYQALEDFQYCIDQTKRCEKYDEIERLRQELNVTRPK